MAGPAVLAIESDDPRACRDHLHEAFEAMLEYLGGIAVGLFTRDGCYPERGRLRAAIHRSMRKKMAMGDWAQILVAASQDPAWCMAVLGSPEPPSFDAESPVTRFVNFVREGNKRSVRFNDFVHERTKARNELGHGRGGAAVDQRLPRRRWRATPSCWASSGRTAR